MSQQIKRPLGWLMVGGVLLIMIQLLIQPSNIAAQDGISSSSAFLPFIKLFSAPPSGVVIEEFATGFQTDTVTKITHAGDERLFVVERKGIIRIVMPSGTILDTPFLDISGDVETGNWEQGMLGLAFHPNYPATPHFFVHYTSKDKGRIKIMRYTVSADPNVANSDSGILFMMIKKTEDLHPVHNGGDIVFGPDGYLYIPIGDGGPDPEFGSTYPHDPANNGYRLTTQLGKILRLDVDGTGVVVNEQTDQCYVLPIDAIRNPDTYVPPFTIPADNPYRDGEGPNCDAIWAKGLRNPWRISFDRLTGDLYIPDVGEWIYDELNIQRAGSTGGEDYGWRCWEGTYDQTAVDHPIYADRCGPLDSYTFPIHQYGPDQGCSIVGGYVYRGSRYPQLQGHYLFGDFCNGHLWALSPDGANSWIVTELPFLGLHVSTFGEGADGELYVGRWRIDGKDNSIYKIVVR